MLEALDQVDEEGGTGFEDLEEAPVDDGDVALAGLVDEGGHEAGGFVEGGHASTAPATRRGPAVVWTVVERVVSCAADQTRGSNISTSSQRSFSKEVRDDTTRDE